MARPKYDFSLERVPKGYPAGSVYAPDVYEDGPEFRSCSIQGCAYKPAYELYHGGWLYDMDTPAGLTDGWWYVCRGHKRWLVANSLEPNPDLVVRPFDSTNTLTLEEVKRQLGILATEEVSNDQL